MKLYVEKLRVAAPLRLCKISGIRRPRNTSQRRIARNYTVVERKVEGVARMQQEGKVGSDVRRAKRDSSSVWRRRRIYRESDEAKSKRISSQQRPVAFERYGTSFLPLRFSRSVTPPPREAATMPCSAINYNVMVSLDICVQFANPTWPNLRVLIAARVCAPRRFVKKQRPRGVSERERERKAGKEKALLSQYILIFSRGPTM